MIFLTRVERDLLVFQIQEMLTKAALDRSCVSCVHFEESSELCLLAGARPPARVIASGCQKYVEEAPF